MVASGRPQPESAAIPPSTINRLFGTEFPHWSGDRPSRSPVATSRARIFDKRNCLTLWNAQISVEKTYGRSLAGVLLSGVNAHRLNSPRGIVAHLLTAIRQPGRGEIYYMLAATSTPRFVLLQFPCGPKTFP